MENRETKSPPKLALLFFRWFCHPDFREEIEGDLTERFYQRSKQYSSLHNKTLFIKDVVSLLRPQLIVKLHRFTHVPFSFLKLIYHNLRITALIIAPLWLISFIALTFINSKGCKQIVIDSSEVRMGIDIPKVDFCNCYYNEEKDIRLSLYTLKVNVDNYLKTNNFIPINTKDIHLSLPLPDKEKPTSEQLYVYSGNKWGNTWQYAVEKESGRIWVELIYTPTVVTNIMEIITTIIFYFPPLLIAMWFIKFLNMIYRNMRKLKISPF